MSGTSDFLTSAFTGIDQSTLNSLSGIKLAGETDANGIGSNATQLDGKEFQQQNKNHSFATGLANSIFGQN